MRFTKLCWLIAVVVAGGAFAQPQTGDTNDAAFQAFLGEVRASAVERGIRSETLDAVLPTIRIRRAAVEADRSQAEFVLTSAAYLARKSVV